MVQVLVVVMCVVMGGSEGIGVCREVVMGRMERVMRVVLMGEGTGV